jgi:hypothetical protein
MARLFQVPDIVRRARCFGFAGCAWETAPACFFQLDRGNAAQAREVLTERGDAHAGGVCPQRGGLDGARCRDMSKAMVHRVQYYYTVVRCGWDLRGRIGLKAADKL